MTLKFKVYRIAGDATGLYYVPFVTSHEYLFKDFFYFTLRGVKSDHNEARIFLDHE